MTGNKTIMVLETRSNNYSRIHWGFESHAEARAHAKDIVEGTESTAYVVDMVSRHFYRSAHETEDARIREMESGGVPGWEQPPY